ncbi:SpoIIE family protein phosphatase [Lentzea sp. E54]|uniref:SpoIIE family protein phosphatase n=1 Tax=Lentzea xerophila TaxID=3435883 RepID=UPI003DA342BE
MTVTGHDDSGEATAYFDAFPEDSVEDLYDDAPCGYLSTLVDGRIIRVNATLSSWLGYKREELVGSKHFTDLLTAGGKLYHETHYAPMLRMHGCAREIAFDVVAADGRRLPVLVTATVKTTSEGRPAFVRVTVFDAQERRAYEQELLRARREAERDRERLQRLNTTLQRTLLPPVLPKVRGLDVAAAYHAASRDEIGGDFYDLFPIGTQRWGFFLGDVCGKGPEAAVLTSLTRYTIRAAAVHDTDVLGVLTTLNEVLLQEYQPTTRFCTVVFGLLEREADGFRIILASGGHPPPLVIRATGEVEQVRTPGGQLVGILPRARFVAATTVLGKGDVLMLYTDGLTEARRADGTQFGEEQLIETVATSTGSDAATVVATATAVVREWSDGQSDDIAVLAFGPR